MSQNRCCLLLGNVLEAQDSAQLKSVHSNGCLIGRGGEGGHCGGQDRRLQPRFPYLP